jgi:hypothetical protein
MNWDYFWIVVGGIIFAAAGAGLFYLLSWLWWIGAIVGLVVYLLILAGKAEGSFIFFDF